MPKQPPRMTVEVFTEREVQLLGVGLAALVDMYDSGALVLENAKPGELEALRLKIIVAAARQRVKG